MIARLSLYCLAATLILTSACTRETNAPLVTLPQFDLTDGSAVVSVSVVGPNGNICNSLAAGRRVQVFAIDISPTPQGGGAQNLTCPQNTLAFTLPFGTYLFRARLPGDGAIAGAFPLHTYTLTPVQVSGDASVEIAIAPGILFGGGVTLNGQPYPGIGLTFVHADATGFGVAFGQSSAAGAWEETTFLSRPQMILQSGIRVAPFGNCDLLGTRLLEPFSLEPFEFPAEKSGISCDMVDAPAVQFSHNRTRLVVTPGPGDIGGGQLALSEELGNGWGVQFPVNPGEQPRIGDIAVSQLFQGGLVIGLKPDRVLSANELGGYFPCGPVCRDFGPDGQPHYNASPTFGKKVTWQYSDGNSLEGVGIKVVQKSYDGVPPADYVLFRFTLTNSGPAAQTFYSGFFGDWDIDDDFFDDVGATEQGGKLMYVTNSGGGVAAGTLIVGDAPISGNAFFNFDFETNNSPTSTAEFVDALAGDFGSPAGDYFGDKWLVHAIGPITVKPGKSSEMWIAVVAGDDVEQLRANATAAETDIAARRGKPDAADAGRVTVAPRVGAQGRGKGNAPARAAFTCKRGCSTLE